jgi:hypothetical protein
MVVASLANLTKPQFRAPHETCPNRREDHADWTAWRSFAGLISINGHPSRTPWLLPQALYEFLTSGRPIPDRKLTRLGGKQRPDKEAIMLDIAFVAAGVAFSALMGAYAHALRQL